MFFLLSGLFWPFLLLDLAFLGVILATEENALFPLTALVLVIYAAIAWWWFKIDIFGWTATHWGDLLIYALIYVVIGVVWSFIKWYFWVRQDWVRAIIRGWYDKTRGSRGFGEHPREIDPSQNKSRIVSWMMYWPFSLFWSIFSDLLTNIFNAIYDFVAKGYGAISRAIVKSVMNSTLTK